jgi:hypothetical protein
VIYWQRELLTWQNNWAKINADTEDIVRCIGRCLHLLMWLTPTHWVFMLLPKDWLDCFTEWYVVVVLIASVLIYCFVPGFWFALLSTAISASTLNVMLHIVFLQRAFGPIKSAERSLLLFMCNVAQIVFMFATWYRLGCYSGTDALLKSVLTFATIGYAECMPLVAMAQIATDFLLLTIFLGFLLGQFGAKNGGK